MAKNENAIEIMLDVLRYIQGEFFNDAKVVDIGSWENEGYSTLKLRNEDTLKVRFEYIPHVEEQSDVEE